MLIVTSSHFPDINIITVLVELKQRVLCNSGPVSGLLAYWPSRLKALVAMGLAIRLTCHMLA